MTEHALYQSSNRFDHEVMRNSRIACAAETVQSLLAAAGFGSIAVIIAAFATIL